MVINISSLEIYYSLIVTNILNVLIICKLLYNIANIDILTLPLPI